MARPRKQAAPASTAGTLYVVERLNWGQAAQDRNWKGFLRLPGTTRLQSFSTSEEAQADCDRREEQLRRRVNPFVCGGASLACQTHLAPDAFHDWLLDADITPPEAGAKGARDWAKWWKKAGPTLDARQWAHVWQALDRVRFHRVVERPNRPVGYVVLRIGWGYNDEWYYAHDEGGEAMQVFRSRQNAEAYLKEATDIARDAWGDGSDDEDTQFEDNARRCFREDPFAPVGKWSDDYLHTVEQQQFYEIVEVELDSL